MDAPKAKSAVKNPKQLFQQFLREQGLRCTAERLAVLDRIQENHGHFDANQIVSALQENKPRVSKASVYRTLALLTEAGILRQVLYGEKHFHYEHTYDAVRHDHLVCRRCGKIIEFANAKIEKIQDRICRKHKFLPEGYRLQIYGLCRQCQTE